MPRFVRDPDRREHSRGPRYVVHRRKRTSDPPRQDPSRRVVDDRVQIGSAPVEQADDGGVDVPRLVGSFQGRRLAWRCTRSRGRRQHFCPTRGTSWGEAQTLPSRCASPARVRSTFCALAIQPRAVQRGTPRFVAMVTSPVHRQDSEAGGRSCVAGGPWSAWT
jgi:hypothetical protein